MRLFSVLYSAAFHTVHVHYFSCVLLVVIYGGRGGGGGLNVIFDIFLN